MSHRPFVVATHFLAAAVGLLAAVLLADRVVLPVLVRHGQAIEVPDVVGLRPEEAKRVLKRSRLNLVVAAEKYDATVPDGTLCAQAPDAGSRVKSGRNIRALLSLGTRQMTMPPLARLPLDHARVVLSNAGLSLRDVLWCPSSSYPGGATIASSPAAGDTVGAGEAVDLLVSTGAPPASYVLPDLRGRMIEEVVPLLQRAGIEHQSGTRHMGFGAEPGLILQQQPRPGSMVSQGDTLMLWLSAETSE
jgi:beta-lactam-binding protein with PASTA domain